MDFIDLKTQYRRLQPAVSARMSAVLEHGLYIMGPEVRELEEKLADFTSSAHCVSCASGSDALLMVLMAWGAGPGDAVFVPAFSFFATAEMPALLGATPIFVDIEPETFNMDTACLARAINAVRTQDTSLHPLPPQALGPVPLHPRCIIPVDLFGQAASYETLLPLASAEGLPVLEDGAQSFGGLWQGRRVCGLGCTAAGTSFFPAKPLGCYGDGGAIFTDDVTLAEELRSIRIHGKGADKYDNRRIGINGRLDTLQAAVLLAKLDIFEDELLHRQRVADMYAERLDSLPGIVIPCVSPDRRSVFGQYTVRVKNGRRDAVAAKMKTLGVPTNIYYPKPLHTQGAFSKMEIRTEDMPVAAQCCREVLSLPFHPYMDKAAVDAVCSALKHSLC